MNNAFNSEIRETKSQNCEKEQRDFLVIWRIRSPEWNDKVFKRPPLLFTLSIGRYLTSWRLKICELAKTLIFDHELWGHVSMEKRRQT